ncbi:EamA family transporter [Candidatus Dojkabacteria bacterium]|nr:EamA family transporter [Candidatus Dojkabacteria bacterium]
MLIAILGGLGASVFWAAADVLIKKSVDKISTLLSLFLFRLGTVICTFPLVFYDKSSLEWSGEIIWLIIGFAILQLVITALLFSAFRFGKVSFVSPIVSTYTLISAIISFMFFGEEFESVKLILVGFVYLGIILVGLGLNKENSESSLEKGKNHSYGFFAAIAVMVAYAIFFPAYDSFIDRDGWGMLIFVESTFVTLLVVPFLLMNFKEVVKTPKKVFWIALFAGLFNGLGNLGLSLGLEFSEQTTVTVAAASSTSAVAVLFAYIFLKERMGRLQYLGISVIVFGLILSVLF